MRTINVLILMTMILALSLPVSAATIAYWDFDDEGAVDSTLMPGNGERADLDTDGAMDTDDFRISTEDKSGNGNHLTAWTMTWMNWSADSLMGDFSMTENNAWPAAGTDNLYNAGLTGIDAETIQPAQWTVEAVFKATDVSGNRGIVGRDGMHNNLASMYFAIRGGNLSIEYMDVDGNWHVNNVAAGLVANQWYHAAGVSDGTTLKLYLDLTLIGTLDLTASGSLDTALTADIDANGEYYGWTVSRGMWGGNDLRDQDHTDRFLGFVDMVAISDTALAPGSFAYEIGPGGLAASNPDPQPYNATDGTVGTLVGTPPNYDADVTLNFKAGKDPNTVTNLPVNPAILRHYVYVSISGTDPNLTLDGYVDHVNYNDPNVEYDITLDDGSFYHWQVEEGLDNGTGNAYSAGDPNNILGPVWSFNTVAAIPTFLTQPRPAVADGSGDASFSVTASSTATDYRWFKVGTPDVQVNDGGIYSGATTATLTITGAVLADEAAFYCIAYNGDPDAGGTSSLPSDAAWLVMPRLVGYWTLNNTMADSVASEVTGAVAHNGFMNSGDPNYVTDPDPNGPAGNGMRFFNDGQFMELPDADFFNFYEDGFTTIYWYKQYAGANTDWRLPMSKFDISASGWLFGRNGTNPDTNFIIEQGGANAYTGTLTDGQWNMVTVTYDAASDTLTAYSNGDENAQATVDLSVLPLPSRPVQIGGEDAGGTGNVVDAAISEVRMYSYPLTSTEIATMYTDSVANTWVCVNADDSVIATYDLNNDCRVSLVDFALVATEWLECQRIPTSACTW